MAYELTDQEASDLKRIMLKVNLALMETREAAAQVEAAAMTILNYAHAIRSGMRRAGFTSVPVTASDDATAPITHETLHAA